MRFASSIVRRSTRPCLSQGFRPPGPLYTHRPTIRTYRYASRPSRFRLIRVRFLGAYGPGTPSCVVVLGRRARPARPPHAAAILGASRSLGALFARLRPGSGARRGATASLVDADRDRWWLDLLGRDGLRGHEVQSTARAASHASVCTTISTPKSPDSQDMRCTFTAFSARRA